LEPQSVASRAREGEIRRKLNELFPTAYRSGVLGTEYPATDEGFRAMRIDEQAYLESQKKKI